MSGLLQTLFRVLFTFADFSLCLFSVTNHMCEYNYRLCPVCLAATYTIAITSNYLNVAYFNAYCPIIAYLSHYIEMRTDLRKFSRLSLLYLTLFYLNKSNLKCLSQ